MTRNQVQLRIHADFHDSFWNDEVDMYFPRKHILQKYVNNTELVNNVVLKPFPTSNITAPALFPNEKEIFGSLENMEKFEAEIESRIADNGEELLDNFQAKLDRLDTLAAEYNKYTSHKIEETDKYLNQLEIELDLPKKKFNHRQFSSDKFKAHVQSVTVEEFANIKLRLHEQKLIEQQKQQQQQQQQLLQQRSQTPQDISQHQEFQTSQQNGQEVPVTNGDYQAEMGEQIDLNANGNIDMNFWNEPFQDSAFTGFF